MKYIFKNPLYIWLFRCIDFFGYFITYPYRKLRKNINLEIKKILVIRLDHIGDVLNSTVVIQNLKKTYPQAEIAFLVGSWAKEIVINNPNIDEVLCYDAPWFNRNSKRTFEFKTFFSLAGDLRKNNYDLGIDLRGDFRNIILMALARIKLKTGFGITGGAFLLDKTAFYKKRAHPIENNLELLKKIGINPDSNKPEFYIKETDEESAKKFLTDSITNLNKNDIIAIIHPNAGNSAKNWAEDKFSLLVNKLYNLFNIISILVGSEKDINKNNIIINDSRVPAINAAGKINLSVLLALIKNSSVFIGIDSGPSQIAALSGKPAIILFSGTNKAQEWAPISSNVSIIQKNTSCNNCQLLNCSNNICMDLITVEEVLAKVREVINK